jgi:hypothetical protein
MGRAAHTEDRPSLSEAFQRPLSAFVGLVRRILRYRRIAVRVIEGAEEHSFGITTEFQNKRANRGALLESSARATRSSKRLASSSARSSALIPTPDERRRKRIGRAP